MLSELMYLVSVRSAVAMLVTAAAGAWSGHSTALARGGVMRYAAVLIVAGIVAASAVFVTTAQAQSVITLVSNTGLSASTSSISVGTSSGSKYSHAQSFTTGNNTDGYTLSSVESDIVGSTYNTSDTARVSIYTAASNGKPAALKYTLTTPSSVSDGLNAFTAPAGSTLEKETEYVVVVEQTGSGSFSIRFTTRDGQSSDDTGAGWAIRDNRWGRNSDAGAWSSSNTKLRISVNGVVSASSDATLSDLTIGAGSDTTLLVPGFAAATTSYTASVANSVDEITVTPTTTDAAATVEYLDGSDAGIDDADATADGQQAPANV